MALFGLLLGLFDSKGLVMAAVFAGFGSLLLWDKVIANRRRATLDAAKGQVTISRVSAFFKPKQRVYPLELFGSVQSYIEQGKFPINRLEIVTKTGVRYCCLLYLSHQMLPLHSSLYLRMAKIRVLSAFGKRSLFSLGFLIEVF